MALTPTPAQGQSAQAAPSPELVDGAPQYWTLYPALQPVGKQVLPAGMWPWESPVAKAARAEKGEDPNEPPHDYAALIEQAITFPFGKPEPEHPHAERQATHAQAQRQGAHPPAATQH